MYYSDGDLSDYCMDCNKLHTANRIEVPGKLRFININRDKSIAGQSFRSKARLDMSNFNLISCILHFGYNCITISLKRYIIYFYSLPWLVSRTALRLSGWWLLFYNDYAGNK
jgi:hypothetical protein